MKTIYLVSCVSKKRSAKLPAEELYRSDLFQKSRAYVLRQMRPGDEWYVLSAKHGLVSPRLAIEPYNETLNNMGKRERQEWAHRVEKDLRNLLRPGDVVVFLAGQNYREFLEPALSGFGCSTLVPMRGMRIGEQLRWLDREGN